MRTLIGVMLVLGIESAGAQSSLVLQARVLTTKNRMGAALIVGRTACNRSVWLLTDTPELFEVSPERHISGRVLRHLTPNDRPWGLACVAGALWTLPNPRALGRLTTDGDLVERIELRLPRVALFGTGDRVVYQQLPTAAAEPVLTIGPPRNPLDARPWRGLLSRSGRSREDYLTRNLVNCGLPHAGWLPCWFADDAQITISNGVSTLTKSFRPLLGPAADAPLPVWDVALADNDRLWLLATDATTTGGRRLGGRLIVATREGRELGHLRLAPQARLIVSATAARCVLLTAQGELMEVVAQ
jgi:hypothetical protein